MNLTRPSSDDVQLAVYLAVTSTTQVAFTAPSIG